MSSALLKIYSFFIVTTFLFSSMFLNNRNITNKQQGEQPSLSVNQNDSQNSNNSITGGILVPELATTSKNKILQPERKTLQPVSGTNIDTTFVATTAAVPTQNTSRQAITEINTQESDNQTTTARPNPCVIPIAYTLGIFDTRFNISKNYFLTTITNSASLWNKAVDKKLFVYDIEGKTNSLTINLIYDERQRKTDENKLLGVEIMNTKEASEKLESEYEAMKIIFLGLKNEYVKRVETFNTQQKTYNDTVLSWNEKGGAPRSEYDALTQEKENLIKESEQLIHDRQVLDAMLIDINTKITRHNELVLFANQNVDINNNTAHKKFTEGNYNSETNSINIYQFSDDTKLGRVLTHELGHALGIDHTKDSQSIMYAINNATTTLLAQQDIQEIKDVCSKK